MRMETSRADEAQPRKRTQRVQLACLPCRQSKLKCNRESPVCDQCYKRSRESSCVYSERGLRYNAARQRTESMRDKVDRLELFVNRIKDARNEPATSLFESHHKSDTRRVEEDISPLIGNLRLSETGATQYVAPGHWESIIEDIADVKAYFQHESTPNQSNSDDTEWSSSVLPIDVTFGLSPTYTKMDILALLPPKSEFDRYVSTWFNVPDHLSVILHGPTFRAQYQQFWIQPDTVTLAWLSLLLSVSCVGAEISSQLLSDPTIAVSAENLRRLAAHALVLADYMTAQPFVIEALIFRVKGLLLKHHDVTRATWQLHGQTMRLCFLAGYHRDPGNNPAISPFDCEMRRRVWMIVSEYDVLSCQQIGMTSLVDPNMLDTITAANLTDNDFSDAHMQPARSADEYTPMLVAVQHSKVTRALGEASKTIGGTILPSRADLEKQRSRILSTRDELPPVLRFARLDESFTDSPNVILDRYRLEILHKKALCVLYRPFVGKEGYHQERAHCLVASEDVVRLSVAMVEACQPSGQFSGFRVHVRRHVHDFNLAAMLLCSGLKHSAMTKDTDWDDRIRALLLQACGLWSLSGVTSQKARHCISAIEKFLMQDDRFVGPEGGKPDALCYEAVDGGIIQDNAPLRQVPNDQDAVAGFPGAFSVPLVDGMPETFNIMSDPLFQQLFGTSHSSLDGYDPGYH